MNINRTARRATTVAVSGAAATASLAALALGSGVAHADPYNPNAAPAHTWCPGQALPFNNIRWNNGACHTWYIVPFGTGNVRMVDLKGNALDSFIAADIPAPIFPPAPPPPPLPPGTPFCSPRGSLIIIPPICDEIGVDLPPGSVPH
jgi:hypothetical protein